MIKSWCWWWIRFAGFWCGLNLNTEFCRADAHPPQNPNIHSFQPQNFVFLSRTPLFLVQDPLGDPLPSLPASLSVLLSGSSESTIAQALLKREHIQWGLSQSLSVSIKDPGNTTLSTEPLLKGQWDPGLQPESQHLPSFSWEREKKQELTQQINYSWMVCEPCSAFSQAASASTISVQTYTITSDITVCNNTATLHFPPSDGDQGQQHLFRLQLMMLRSVLAEEVCSNKFPDILMT